MMSKKGLIFFLIMCILMVSISSGFEIVNSSNIVYVGNGCFETIQEGVNNANIGDTVFVYNGTYCEMVYINKSINLVGENKESTIIDVSGFKHGIVINSDFVNVSGFTLRNSGPEEFDSAIRVMANYSSVSNCCFYNNLGGVSLMPSSNSKVFNNLFKDSFAGIDVYGYGIDAVENEVFDNYLINVTYAIWIGFAHDNEFFENKFMRNRYAFMMEDSYDNLFYDNYFKNNHLNARFTNISKNKWMNNFWDRPRFLPYVIFGYREIGFLKIPMFNVDWKPMIVAPIQ